MDDLWKCYDKSSGSPTMMSIEGVAGSCYRNVTPVRLHSAHVWDEDFSASTSPAPRNCGSIMLRASVQTKYFA